MTPKLDPEKVKAAIQGLLNVLHSGPPCLNIRSRIDDLLDALAPGPGKTGRAIDAAQLSDEARLQLEELRSKLLHPGLFWLLSQPRAAADLLQQCLTETEPPWDGPDWDEVQQQVRLLLLYMRGRHQAEIEEVREAVWMQSHASGNAIRSAVKKANKFLQKRQERRVLTLPRGKGIIRWE